MQKLIFRNSKGVEINLTEGNYFVVSWSGLSNVGQELQTQKVPFVDGSVYLDNLLNERELSFTVALNDEKDLAKRYELRRELISVLNPKLKEGYLIYENDYLSKQIKVIPDAPIIPNKNFDEAGTIKCELVFTACSPYWEDMETQTFFLRKNRVPVIINNGDVKNLDLKLNITSSNCESIKFKNIVNNSELLIEGVNGDMEITTGLGNKKAIKKTENAIITNLISGVLTDLIECGEYIFIVTRKYCYLTKDFKYVEKINLPFVEGRVLNILYHNNKYYFCLNLQGTYETYYTEDFVNFEVLTITENNIEYAVGDLCIVNNKICGVKYQREGEWQAIKPSINRLYNITDNVIIKILDSSSSSIYSTDECIVIIDGYSVSITKDLNNFINLRSFPEPQVSFVGFVNGYLVVRNARNLYFYNLETYEHATVLLSSMFLSAQGQKIIYDESKGNYILSLNLNDKGYTLLFSDINENYTIENTFENKINGLLVSNLLNDVIIGTESLSFYRRYDFGSYFMLLENKLNRTIDNIYYIEGAYYINSNNEFYESKDLKTYSRTSILTIDVLYNNYYVLYYSDKTVFIKNANRREFIKTDKIYYYSNDEIIYKIDNVVYHFKNNSTNQINFNFNSVAKVRNSFYLAQGNKIYKSDDLQDFTEIIIDNFSYSINLFSYSESLQVFFILCKKNNYEYIITTNDFSELTIIEESKNLGLISFYSYKYFIFNSPEGSFVSIDKNTYLFKTQSLYASIKSGNINSLNNDLYIGEGIYKFEYKQKINIIDKIKSNLNLPLEIGENIIELQTTGLNADVFAYLSFRNKYIGV